MPSVRPEALLDGESSQLSSILPKAWLCSVVIPFFNEEISAPRLLDELAQAESVLGGPVEVLLIDDGSADGTARVLRETADRRPGWRVLHHGENQGQAAALLRGMRTASAEIIVTLDGDGQNDPADIAAALERLGGDDAPDLVSGVRARRSDSWLRKRMSRVANAVRRRLLRDGVRDTGCGFKVFRRPVMEAFLPIRTLYSFMPALAVAAGFRVVEMTVNHRPRLGGKSSYGLRAMLWRPLLDMLGVWWFTRRRFPIAPLSACK